jgi:hypothetical protein
MSAVVYSFLNPEKKALKVEHSICFASVCPEYKQVTAGGKEVRYLQLNDVRPETPVTKEQALLWLTNMEIILPFVKGVAEETSEEILRYRFVTFDIEKHSSFRIYSAMVYVRYLYEFPQVVAKYMKLYAEQPERGELQTFQQAHKGHQYMNSNHTFIAQEKLDPAVWEQKYKTEFKEGSTKLLREIVAKSQWSRMFDCPSFGKLFFDYEKF